MKTIIDRPLIMIAIGVLSILVAISMGMNYYLAHFDYSTILKEGYSSIEIYSEYYEVRGVIYFLNTFLILIILVLGLYKKKQV